MRRVIAISIVFILSIGATLAAAPETSTARVLRKGKTITADTDYYMFTASETESLVSSAEEAARLKRLLSAVEEKSTLLEKTNEVNSELVEALGKNRDLYADLWRKAETDNRALIKRKRRNVWRDILGLGLIKLLTESVFIKLK